MGARELKIVFNIYTTLSLGLPVLTKDVTVAFRIILNTCGW